MTLDEVRKRVLEIQARAEKATPGPWRLGKQARTQKTIYTSKDAFVGVLATGYSADFIASARSDVPWLCEELLKARAELEATRGLTDSHGGIVPYTQVESKTTSSGGEPRWETRPDTSRRTLVHGTERSEVGRP